MPRLEIAEEPPWYSAGLSFFLSARGEVFHLVGDGGKRFSIGVADHRREQAAVDRDRDADIGMLEAEDAVAGPHRVGGGHALQSERQRLDDEIVDRELVGGTQYLARRR